MSHVKILATALVATAFAAPALAGDPMMKTESESNHFASADLDQDGALSADEFVTFAVMKAEDGDEDFKALVVSGDYDAKFAAHDADASGTLSEDELGAAEVEEAPEMEMESVEPEMQPEY